MDKRKSNYAFGKYPPNNKNLVFMKKQQRNTEIEKTKVWAEFNANGTQVKLHYSNGAESLWLSTSTHALAAIAHAESVKDIDSGEFEILRDAIFNAPNLPEYFSKSRNQRQEGSIVGELLESRGRTSHEEVPVEE